VVTPQRPWGLIIVAVVVAVFAAAVLTYAVMKVNKSNAEKITSPDQISGVKSYDYPAGQKHVSDVAGPQRPERLAGLPE
jgi:LPS O-antigen subunit length determinant protein (WzzB/FepE family)